jgi:ferredoxin-fold anticodon binding domain-containing protein
VEPKINLLIDGVFEIIEGDELADKHELQKRRLSHLESFSEELSSILDQDPDIYKAMIKKLDKNLAWEIVNRYDFDEEEIWEYILKNRLSHQPNL